MKPLENGGSRVAIVMNGSPLFTGDAGSGESEIRRWILENDWLEAIIALPEQLFYNTGIATYVWILTNGQRFAIIIDEAHSSQTGETSRQLKAVLSTSHLETAAAEEESIEDDTEDRIEEAARTRGNLPNLSYFAFTATPKAKTLELFGTKQPDGTFAPFSLYTIWQAIEEGLIFMSVFMSVYVSF